MNFNIKYLALFFGILFFIQNSFAQNIRGVFRNEAAAGQKITLSAIKGETLTPLDSMNIAKNLIFEFKNNTLEQGLYRLSLTEENYTDVLVSGTEPEIKLLFNKIENLRNGQMVLASDENKIFHEWQLKDQYIEGKIKGLYASLRNIPRTDKAQRKTYLLTVDSFVVYEQEYIQYLVDKHPKSYYTRIYKQYLLPNYDDYAKEYAQGKVRIQYADKKAFEKVKFFDNVDFSNPEFIRTRLYTDRMYEYFRSHTTKNENGWFATVNKIMDTANRSDEVKEHCLQYLLNFFYDFGPKSVLQYTVENFYLEDSCGEIDLSEDIKGAAAIYESLLPGNRAPNAQLPDTEGNIVDLETQVGKKTATILFFWSSHCKYCKIAAPELVKIKEAYENKGIQVIGISLDMNPFQWKQGIEEKGLNWLNLCEEKGWKSDVVQKYKVHKTPYYYLLSSDMTIISRPKKTQDLWTEVGEIVN